MDIVQQLDYWLKKMVKSNLKNITIGRMYFMQRKVNNII
jgi:hypothetical protein